LQFEFVAAL